MDLAKYIEWLSSTAFGFAIICLLNHLLFRTNRRFKFIAFILKGVLVIVLAYLLIAWASPFLWRTDYPLAGIYIAFLSDCFTDFLMSVCYLIKKNGTEKRRIIVSAIMTASVFIYGTINMQMIRANQLVFQTDKAASEHLFVFLSDLHYGSSQSR